MNSIQHVVTNTMLFCIVMGIVAISFRLEHLTQAVSAMSCAAEAK